MNDIVPPVGKPASSALIERVKAILTKPVPTWDVIAAEPSTPQSILTSYVVPLAAIGPIALFVGTVVTSIWLLGLGVVLAMLGPVIGMYIGGLVSVFVLAFLINVLAPSFNGEKNFTQAFKLAAYGCTATWVASALFVILPLGGLAVLCGLVYSLYLMYVGLPKLMKSPADKSAIYLIAVVAIMLVAGFVVRLVLAMTLGFGLFGAGMMHGGLGMLSHKAPVVNTVVVPGVGSMDVDKMQKAADQMAAQASAMQNGQVTVKTADPQALLALMPSNFMGAALTDTTSSSDTAGGVAVSNASGTYTVGSGTIHLKVSDLGTMGGLAGMAQAMNVNHTENTTTGYEKVSTEGGKMVSEKYDNQNKSGEYTVVYGSRISIEADGSNVDMATIKSLVGQIDQGRAEALAK